jgi:glyoxylate/hydroxypyruvate reductase
MALAFFARNRDLTEWIAAIEEANPNGELLVNPQPANYPRVNMAVVWKHEKQVLQQLPNLKLVSSMGAGVDHIIKHPPPKDVPVVRIVDPGMNRQMTRYVCMAALTAHQHLFFYRQMQRSRRWQPNTALHESVVGIMGIGAIGQEVAQGLLRLGFRVKGWSRKRKNLPGVFCYNSSEWQAFLKGTDILVCLLPLTEATAGILNARTFSALNQQATIINVGRGGHLKEEDLQPALDNGQLKRAFLDVFREEPLPSSHPFWNDDRIVVTPHVSAITNPRTAAEQITANYRRVMNNEPLLNPVNMESGY